MVYKGDDKTQRFLKILAIFLLSVPLLISPATAWSFESHQAIVSKAYYLLPQTAQKNLNLDEMKKGSLAPDVTFHDYTRHEYSASVALAQNWLNKGKKAYKSKNYNYASYCFGVASHYIADTFSAPHCIKGESAAQHKAYEIQARGMTPSIRYMSGSLKNILYNGYKQGNKDWRLWIKGSRSPSISQRDLNNAGSAAYSMIKRYI